MTENILITPRTKDFISNEFISNNNNVYQKQLKYCSSGFFTSTIDYLETPLAPIETVLYTEDRQGNNPDAVYDFDLDITYEFDNTNRAWSLKLKAIDVIDRPNFDDILEREETGFSGFLLGEIRRFRTDNFSVTGLDFPGSKNVYTTALYENTFEDWSFFRGGTVRQTESSNLNKTILRFSTFKRGNDFVEETTIGTLTKTTQRDITSDTVESGDSHNPGYLEYNIYENIDLRNGRGTINISKSINLDYRITPYLQKTTSSSEVTTENNIVEDINRYDVVLVSSDTTSAIVNKTSTALGVENALFVIDKLGQETQLPIINSNSFNIDANSVNYIADKKEINYIDIEDNDFIECKESNINYNKVEVFNFSKPEESILSQKQATIKSLKNLNATIHCVSYFPPK